MNDYKIKVREQYRRENELLPLFSTDFCKGEIYERLGALNYPELGDLLSYRFYDCSVMEAMRCYVQGLEDKDPEAVREFFSQEKQIGKPSAYGAVFLTGFGPLEGVFASKVSQRGNEEEMVHEEFVGLAGTNKLRCHVPNYAYLYGSIKNCSAPIVGPERKVVSWCEGSRPNRYVLYENIPNARSFKDFVKGGASSLQFLRAYSQCLGALQCGVDLSDFTHYDLHTDNVLKREIPQEVALPLRTGEGEIEDLVIDSILTFIDFGQSHIVHNGEHFGFHGMEQHYTFSDRSYPAHDAFKLLMFAAEDCFRATQHGLQITNPEVLSTIRVLASFFTPDAIESIVSRQVYGTPEEKHYYVLPYNSQTAQITHLDVLRFLREQFPEINQFFYPHGQAPVPLLTSSDQNPQELALFLENHPPQNLRDLHHLLRFGKLSPEEARVYLLRLYPEHIERMREEERELLRLNIVEGNLENRLERIAELHSRNDVLMENREILEDLIRETGEPLDIPSVQILEVAQTYAEPLEYMMMDVDEPFQERISAVLDSFSK